MKRTLKTPRTGRAYFQERAYLRPLRRATARDRAFVAGLVQGAGRFICRRDGGEFRILVRGDQVTLFWARDRFGGSVRTYRVDERYVRTLWMLHSTRAAGLAMTILGHLPPGPVLEDLRRALLSWRTRPAKLPLPLRELRRRQRVRRQMRRHWARAA